eukprot:5818860-Heterocapsa_arctica.AAC.1
MISRFAISIADETDGFSQEPAPASIPHSGQTESTSTGGSAERDHGTGRDLASAIRLSLSLAELIAGGAE